MAYYKIIGIDAGHGGMSGENYLGTNSVNTWKDNLYEKHYTLELALLVEEFLLYNNFGVAMTRRTDITPGDADWRAKFFLQNKVDYGLSIHFNGSVASATGTEIMVPFGEKYANIEILLGKYLGNIYGQRSPLCKSRYRVSPYDFLGRPIDESTKQFTKNYTNDDYFGIINTSWKNGLSTDLLEVCFLTNQNDFDKWIANKRETGHAIARAIVEGFGKEYARKEEEPVLPPVESPTEPPMGTMWFKINKTYNNGMWNADQKGAVEYTATNRESVLAQFITFYDGLGLNNEYKIFDTGRNGEVVYPIERDCDCAELRTEIQGLNELIDDLNASNKELSGWLLASKAKVTDLETKVAETNKQLVEYKALYSSEAQKSAELLKKIDSAKKALD